jgi:hypothetical protein
VRFRRAALVVILNLCVDLTNPFVGAAFTFEDGTSVEGVARQHQRLSIQTDTAATRVRVAGASSVSRRQVPVARAEVPALHEWFVHLRRAHAPLADPQSATEDH